MHSHVFLYKPLRRHLHIQCVLAGDFKRHPQKPAICNLGEETPPPAAVALPAVPATPAAQPEQERVRELGYVPSLSRHC